MSTAGRSVVIAGATVVISMMGLFLMGLPYLYGVALTASLAGRPGGCRSGARAVFVTMDPSTTDV